MNWASFKRDCLACLALLLFAATGLFAQTTARLTGTVKDQSGGIVAEATVTLTNEATSINHTTKTDGEGNYLFTLVDVGVYRLTVEHTGFKKNVQGGITLEVNQNGRLDVTLEVGQATETIEVTAAAVPQIDTSGAVLGKVESERRIMDLPLVDRDTLQLGLLQAGVFAPDPDDGSHNPFSVSGQRSESLTFLLDGADNNDFLGNNFVVNPNPDAVEEFKILTNNYGAEFGRTSGGIVNTVLKSGTNTFHGDVFEFFRNTVLNARDFFIPVSQGTTPFKRNVFGGTLGGPIKKDKTFFFGDYQGGRRREGQVPPTLTVLSQAERGGNFGELCGAPTNFDGTGHCTNPTGTQLVNPATGNPYAFNQVPVNPVSANYIAKYLPLPTPGLAGNGFISAPVAQINEDQGILKVDHNLTSRDTLSFSYVINDKRDLYPFRINHGASTGGDVPVGSAFSDKERDQVGAIAWTHTFGRGWINELRFSANRVASLQAVPQDHTTPAQLGFTNVNPDDPAGAAPPIIFTPTFNLGPSPQGPTTLNRTSFQVQDNFTLIRGRHEFKFGGDIHRIDQNFNFDFFTNGSFDFGSFVRGGSFSGSALADFVGGFTDNYFQFSNAIYGIRETSQYYYFQDTWKVRPRLTLNLGIRYEYNSPQYDIHNEILGFFPGQQSKVFPKAPPDILYPGDPGTPNRGLVYPDRNNWAPRVGFAWDIFGNAKLVMRGGFGIFYDIEDGALNLQFGGQAPFGSVSNLFPGSSNFAAGNVLADPFTPLGIQNPYPFASRGLTGTFFIPEISFAYVVLPHFRTPYSENFNYGFQYQLTKNTMIEAVYVGSLGRRLIATTDVNPPSPSVEMQQLITSGGSPNLAQAVINGGFINADCARPLGGCPNPNDPSGSFTLASQLLADTNGGLSDSHELQVTVDKRFSHAFTFRGAYTFSKTIDMTSGFRSRSGTFTDPFNPRLDRSLADFDARNRIVLSGLWELPFDRPFHDHLVMKKITEGWQLSGIVSFQSGNPINLFSNNGSSGTNLFLERPDLIGPIQTFDPRKIQTFTPTGGAAGSCLSGTSTGNFFINPLAFNCTTALSASTYTGLNSTGVPLFTFGTLGRNAINGPGINNWNLSLFKRIKLTESKRLELRTELFNAFNHAQFIFQNPNNKGFSGTFGQATQTRGPRLMQLGLKFYF